MFKVVIGLDISKSWVDATLAFQFGSDTEYVRVPNAPKGFQQLIKMVERRKLSQDELVFCLEHTGHYTYKLCAFLAEKGWTYSLINPLQIKRSMGIVRGKSDKADSKVIAEYGLRFGEKLRLNNSLSPELLGLRLLLTHRQSLLEQRKALKIQLNGLRDIRNMANVQLVITDLTGQLRQINSRLKRWEDQLHSYVKEHSEIDQTLMLLMSVPGIGRIIALNMIVYTHNFQRFDEARSFSCYCGVAPFTHQSGSSIRGRNRVSHYANKSMKSLIHMGALSAVKSDPVLRQYYQGKVEQGKNKMCVLNAVRNKLIHRCFAVIRQQSPYEVRA